MTTEKYMRIALMGACLPVLMLVMGCPPTKGTSTNRGDSETTQAKITLQSVFDEAAKGESADLTLLKDMYSNTVTDQASADELAKIKDDQDEYFFCKSLKLPHQSESSFIIADIAGKVTDPVAMINQDCANAKKSLDIVVDPARSVKGDAAEHTDEIIKALVAKGDDATIGAASDKARISRVLDGVKNKGDQAQLGKVMKASPAGVRSDVIAWSATNIADTKIVPAMRQAALITDDMVVTEVQKGAAANPATIQLYYEVAIDTPAKAAALANKPAVGDAKFSNLLALVPAKPASLSVWTKFFAHIEANANAAAVTTEINRAVGAAVAPMASMLANPRAAAAQDDAPSKQEIIALMAEKGNQATIRGATALQLPVLLDAVRAKKADPVFTTVYRHVDPVAKGEALLAWSTSVANATDVVKTAASTLVTPQMVFDEVQKVVAAKAAANAPLVAKTLANTKFLYEAGIMIPAVNGDKGHALQLLNNAGVHFEHFLGQIVPDSELVAIWTNYLQQEFDATGGGAAAQKAAKIAVINTAGGGAGKPLNLVLDHTGLVGDAAAAQNAIVKLMVEEDIAALTAQVSPGNIGRYFTALMNTESQANLLAALNAALAQATLRAQALVWVGVNEDEEIANEAGTPKVKAAITGAALITAARLAALAQDADTAVKAAIADVGNPTHADKVAWAKELIAGVKFFVELTVTDDVTAAALVAEPAGGGTDKFLHYVSRFIANADTLAIWKHLVTDGHLYDSTAMPIPVAAAAGTRAAIDPPGAGAVATLIAAAGAGVSPMKALVDVRANFGDDADSLHKILTLMVDFANNVVIREAVTEAEQFRLVDAVFKQGSAVQLARVFQAADPASITPLGKWTGIHRADTIKEKDGSAKVVAIKKIFTDELFERTTVGDAAPTALRSGLIAGAYLHGGESLIRAAHKHVVTDGLAAAGNPLAAAIDGAAAGAAGASLTAIVAELDANKEPALAITDAGLAAGINAAVKPLVAKAGVDDVTAVIAADFLTEAELKAVDYTPFLAAGAANQSTLLYAVLAKAKVDAGALTEVLVNNTILPVAHDGLAATLKGKFTGGGAAADWQNYLTAVNNLATNQKIDVNLVQPDAGSNAAARLWLDH